VYWLNTLYTWGTKPVNYLLNVGTKCAQAMNTKITIHWVGINKGGFAGVFTQVLNNAKTYKMATRGQISELSPVSTRPTTSITSLFKPSIIKSKSCGRIIYT